MTATSTNSQRNKDAKAEILKRIRSAHALSKQPDAPEIPRNYATAGSISGDELREMLVDRLVDYKADVHECSSDELAETLARVLADRSAKKVVYAPGLDAALFEQVEGSVEADDPARDPRYLDEVDAVVTDSHVSCAETGTITLESNGTNGRRALTLVPDRHVCIVRMDTVVHRVPEMIGRINPALPATMISGPSATSDIELSRVEGVHGPRDLIVIIVR